MIQKLKLYGLFAKNKRSFDENLRPSNFENIRSFRWKIRSHDGEYMVRWWRYIFRSWPYIFRTWPYIFRKRPYILSERTYIFRQDRIFSGQDRKFSGQDRIFSGKTVYFTRTVYFQGPYILPYNTLFHLSEKKFQHSKILVFFKFKIWNLP